MSASPRYHDDAELDAVHIAWAGSTEPGAPHYYRVQGPRLLIEWDNTQRGANHAHSVWRDPTADFGFDLLSSHHAAHHSPTRVTRHELNWLSSDRASTAAEVVSPTRGLGRTAA